MGKVAAGSLNKRITIERRVSTTDSWGQPTEAWETIATVLADIRTVSGLAAIRNEMQVGGTEVSRTPVSIRIRKRSGIDHTMRVVYQSSIFEIRDVLTDFERGEYMDLVCAVGAREG